MKLTVFHSDKGDCLLLTGKDGRRMLADGGMSKSFDASVAPVLAKLPATNGKRKIDVVYVSHIDDDHIGGVCKMLDDAVAWAVHDHQVKTGNTKHKAPKVPRPPEIGEFWHNGFRDMLEENAGDIEQQLAANAIVFSGFTGSAELEEAVAEHQNLALSVENAVKLAQRIGDGQLGIPLNKPAKGKLFMIRPGSDNVMKIGGMTFRLLAPFKEDVEALRDVWNAWLKQSKATLAEIRKASAKVEGELAAATGTLTAPLVREAQAAVLSLSTALETVIPADLKKKMGDRKAVTPPNLASLMFHVSEGKRSILLTGDGFGGDVVKGLKKHKLLKNGGIHVDILKVQHHGSEHNMTEDFATAVSADNYVFCGNGFSTNPELVVLQRLFDARLGPADKRCPTAPSRPFKFWFNADGQATNTATQKAHMKKVEAFVRDLVRQSKQQLSATFLAENEVSFTI